MLCTLNMSASWSLERVRMGVRPAGTWLSDLWNIGVPSSSNLPAHQEDIACCGCQGLASMCKLLYPAQRRVDRQSSGKSMLPSVVCGHVGGLVDTRTTPQASRPVQRPRWALCARS